MPASYVEWRKMKFRIEPKISDLRLAPLRVSHLEHNRGPRPGFRPLDIDTGIGFAPVLQSGRQ